MTTVWLKLIKIKRTGKHIPYRGNKGLTGTIRYSSLNIHLGSESARRDDLESLTYVIVYLYFGGLPWQSYARKFENRNDMTSYISEMKNSISPFDLCGDMPEEFSIILEYIRNIKFEEKPGKHNTI